MQARKLRKERLQEQREEQRIKQKAQKAAKRAFMNDTNPEFRGPIDRFLHGPALQNGMILFGSLLFMCLAAIAISSFNPRSWITGPDAPYVIMILLCIPGMLLGHWLIRSANAKALKEDLEREQEEEQRMRRAVYKSNLDESGKAKPSQKAVDFIESLKDK